MNLDLICSEPKERREDKARRKNKIPAIDIKSLNILIFVNKWWNYKS